MRESKFNNYFTAGDGEKLAFNSYTCALAAVDEKYEMLLSKLDELGRENVPEELRECYEMAKEGHFIVQDDYDEMTELYTKRNFQKYSIESLGLTIAPTLGCNFKCIYCYETSKPGIMQPEVSDKIVEFVEKQSSHLKSLNVTWYGGEPLLTKELLYSLSEKFIEICNQKKINYEAFIISNGSLLDDATIQKLIKYQVKGIQITVDGPPEIHDKRRVNKKGETTFPIILENINKLLATNNIEVVLRINVDKTNDQQVEELIDILDKRLVSKNIRITFGQVTAYTDACKSIEDSCYNNTEFAGKLLEYYKILQKYGFDSYNQFPYPEVKLNYCCAELMNSFVVDPDGYLYKCWNEVGNIKSAVGNIREDSFDITGYKNGGWLKRNPLNAAKCKDCTILPVCMGGCPYNDVALKQENVCDLIKYNVKNVMLTYYENSKQEAGKEE